MSTPFSLPVREQPLILATRNPGKVRELADALRRFGFDVRPLPDDFPEIEETGTTFEQNALLKAHAVAERRAWCVFRALRSGYSRTARRERRRAQ